MLPKAVTSPQSRKEQHMWIDTRECVPLEDGFYLVQTVTGEVIGYEYTHEAGWNTHYDDEGHLHDKNAIEDTYIARWYKATKPKPVPDEWWVEHRDRWIKERSGKCE